MVIFNSITVEVQERGWMDEHLMLEWIEEYIKSYTKNKSSILVLDSFRGHLSNEVNTIMKTINVAPGVIPGGYTSLLQHLDVNNINKPLKECFKHVWMQYILVDRETDKVKHPSKQ